MVRVMGVTTMTSVAMMMMQMMRRVRVTIYWCPRELLWQLLRA